MRLRPAPLEDWLRDYYFTADIDISSSGVQTYTMAELRAKTGVRPEDLDRLTFDDGYSTGDPALRRLIADRFGDGDPGRVITANGSSEAISLVLSTLLGPGDEVVAVQPGYHLLVAYAEALGCTTRTWTLPAERGFRPAVADLEPLVSERTRAIVLNFPHNPTGAHLTEEELRQVVALAERAGAYVLWDGAFTSLVYDAPPLPPVSTLYERGIDFGTFSKAFGLPGLRFGWCVAPPSVIDGCVRIRDYTTLHVAPLIELLAGAVIEHAPAFLEPRLRQATSNRALLAEWAGEQGDRVELALPGGGVAAFPRLPGLADTRDFCDDLFKRHGVLVIPGACFGAPEHIRLGFGGATEQLTEGLERLGRALADWPA
ncbi:capreomycidine synthase [Dactylosporangium sp. NPDC051541]|uniref:capreomycidine synthase n=1 Tax=Dactylosporangium sp. NPDC051541 TaxID=3363977 RepID=UPI00379B11C0